MNYPQAAAGLKSLRNRFLNKLQAKFLQSVGPPPFLSPGVAVNSHPSTEHKANRKATFGTRRVKVPEFVANKVYVLELSPGLGWIE